MRAIQLPFLPSLSTTSITGAQTFGKKQVVMANIEETSKSSLPRSPAENFVLGMQDAGSRSLGVVPVIAAHELLELGCLGPL